MSKWPIILGTLSAILLGGLLGGSSVNAVSSYDNVVELTEELILYNGDGSQSINLSTSWRNEIVSYYNIRCNAGSTEGCTNKTLFESLVPSDDSNWAVFLSEDNKSMSVLFSDDISSGLEFYTDGSGNKTIRTKLGSSYYFPQFTYNPAGIGNNFTSENGLTGGTNEITPLPDNYIIIMEVYQHMKIFISTFSIDYPVDYEGEIIPDTYNPPAPPLDWSPDVNMVNVVDWKITLQDKNFNTFDPVPFTCNQGLTPVIQYDLYNNDTDPITKLATGVFSPTVPFEFQSEKYDIETEYKFIGNYYCGDDITTFSKQTTYYFTVNAAGSYIPPTDSCYADTFPFIDLNGCTGVLENFLNNLSFGAISFPDWSINNDSCHTLGIIGDWINVPASSRTICPQFPAEIRNIVTPFLTFILGLTILGVIVTKSRSDTH